MTMTRERNCCLV